MNKNEFLHAVQASVLELHAIVKESKEMTKKRHEVTERAYRHLKNLYKIIDIAAKNLPNGIDDAKS